RPRTPSGSCRPRPEVAAPSSRFQECTMSAAAPKTQGKKSAPLARVMRPVNSLVEKFIPSAFVFAVVLTFVVAIAALVLTDAGPTDVLTGWGDGLAGLLAFMTQMALILLLGHTLANTGPVRKLLARLGGVPKT